MRRAGASHIRVRANLSLGFPDTDIDCIEPMPGRAPGGDDALRITANFFGLYGVSSPLPTFYTEDLLDDQREGRHARREFFDILHASLYPLLFEAWRKYRLQLRAVEGERRRRALDMLYAFAGLGSAPQRDRPARCRRPAAPPGAVRAAHPVGARLAHLAGRRLRAGRDRGRVLRAALDADPGRSAHPAGRAGAPAGRGLSSARGAVRGLRQPGADRDRRPAAALVRSSCCPGPTAIDGCSSWCASISRGRSRWRSNCG